MTKPHRRDQTRKPRAMSVPNPTYAREMQELRRSNAAGAHKTPKSYSRRPKHFKGWE